MTSLKRLVNERSSKRGCLMFNCSISSLKTANDLVRVLFTVVRPIRIIKIKFSEVTALNNY